MTNFLSITKSLTKRKLHIVNRVLLIDLIAIILTILFKVYQGDLKSVDPLLISGSYAVIAFFVAFILISRSLEHIYTSDSFRLVPISDTRLYNTNLLSAVISYAYLTVIEIIIVTVSTLMDIPGLTRAIGDLTFSSPHNAWKYLHVGEALEVTLGVAAFFAAMVIFAWTTISFIHLIADSLANFLPDGRQRFYRFILYVVVIIGMLYIVGYIVTPFSQWVGGLQPINSQSWSEYVQPYISALGFLVLAGIESFINIYLLKNWVETKNW